jgi:membrane protein DedA with SNARE-associated domain
VDVLDAFVLLIAAGGTVMLVRLRKFRPAAMTRFDTFAFWLWPSSVTIGAWLIAAGYLLGKYAPQTSAKTTVVLLVGGLLLIDFVVMLVVAPFVRSRAARRKRARV